MTRYFDEMKNLIDENGNFIGDVDAKKISNIGPISIRLNFMYPKP